MTKCMKMADGTETGVVGEVTKVAITVEMLTCQMMVLLFSSPRFCFTSEIPARKQLKASFYFDKTQPCLKERERTSVYLYKQTEKPMTTSSTKSSRHVATMRMIVKQYVKHRLRMTT